MLIDFNAHLINTLTNEPVVNSDGSTVTLSDVAVACLINQDANEVLTGQQKLDYWTLANKINKAEVQVKAEEVALLKERIGKMQPPVIVGLSYALLEA